MEHEQFSYDGQPVQLRLMDFQVAIGFYAALLGLVSLFEPLKMVHFTISGSIALFVLTVLMFRNSTPNMVRFSISGKISFFVLTVLMCKNRTSEMESSIQFSHLFGAAGHALILALKLGYPKQLIDRGQGKPMLQIVGVFLLFIAAAFCLISVIPIIKSGFRERRFGMMCYGLLGALPFVIDLAYLHYGLL